MAETELDRMVVRLMGDGSSYFAMLKRAELATSRVAKRVGRSLTSMGRALGGIGRSLSIRLTAPIVGVGVAMVKLGGDFQSEMSKIVGLVGVAEDQVSQWSDEILRMAPSLGKSPVELAKAMFFVTSAGFRGAEAMDVLVQSAKASAGGMGDTAVVADAVTSAVNAYASAGLKAGRATDILTAAVKEGKLEAASLAPVLGRVLPMASAMGVTFEDAAGFLAVMSRTGMEAAEGAVALQGMLVNLQKPADGAKKALKGTGISFQSLRDMVRKPGGVIEAVRLLDKTFGDDEEALAELIPNIRALRGAMNVLAQDSSIVDSVMKGVAKSAGSTETAFQVATRTVKFRLAAAYSQLKVLLVSMGGTVLPLFSSALSRVQEVLVWVGNAWQKLPDHVKKTVVVIAAITAVIGPLLIGLGGLIALAGFALTGLGSMMGVLGMLLSPIALITAAVVGLGASVLHWTGVGGKMLAWFGRQWQSLIDYIQPAIDGIKNALAADDIDLAFKIAWAQIELTFAQGIRPLVEAWAGFVMEFKKIWAEATAWVGIKWTQAAGGWALVWEGLKYRITGDTEGMAERILGILGHSADTIGLIEADLKKAIGSAEEEAVASMRRIQKNIKDLEGERGRLAAEAAEKAAKKAGKIVGEDMPEIPVVPKFEVPPSLDPITIPVKFKIVEAALFGSAEHLKRLAEFRAGAGIGAGPRPEAAVNKFVVSGKETTVEIKSTNEILTEIKVLAEQFWGVRDPIDVALAELEKG